MATVTRPSTPLPDPGDEMDAEQVRDWLNNVLTFLESTNIDEANVDLTSTDGIMGKSTAQTMTGKKSFESTNAAAAGIVEVAEFGLNPSSGTAADNDEGRLVLYADDDAGTASDLVNLDWVLTDASTGSKDSEFRIRALVAGTMTEFLTAGATAAGVGRVAITGDMTVSDDVSLSSDSAVLNFGADSDISLTHVADTGLTMAGAHANGTNLQINNTASDGDSVIQFALSGTVQYSLGVEDGDSDKFVINYGTGSLGAQPALEIDSSGNTSIGGTLGTTGAATLASLVCTAGATFGGGYGSTGATISTAGVIQADGAITSSGAVTGSTLAGTISTAAQNSITSASSLATVGTITSGTWSGVIDGSATMTLGSDATGDIYYRDASGFLERLGASTDGYVLTTGGAGAGPAWESVPGGGISFSGSTADGMVTYGSSSSAIVESTLTFASDALTATSTSADLPKIELKNTHADATAGKFVFTKDPGSGQGADNDVMGTIEFFGTDASNNAAEKLAYIDAYVVEADHGSEAAGLRVYVAENDATNTLGLSVTGSASADGRIDATIGAGSASVVTIPGNIDLDGDIDVIGTLEADAITLGGTALGSLYSPIAGSSSIVTVGTIGTGTWQGIAVASAYLDADTAHLSTTQTFTGDKTFTGTVTVGVDDTGKDVKFFGASAGAFMLYDESTYTLEVRGPSADATTSTGKLKLTTALTDINDNDVLGRIDFAAPLEDGGTDAILAGGAIWAEAEATFSSTVNSTALVFGTNTSAAATERMRIDSSGNVGIGTTAPTDALSVAFSASDMTSGLVVYNTATDGNGPAIRFESDYSGSRKIHSAINGNADGSGGALSFHTSADNSALTRHMIIKPDGNVGIGTSSPGGKLSIYDSTAADYTAMRIYQGGDANYYWDFTADVDAGDLIIGGNHSSFDLILNPSYGNVGIGTSSPAHAIDVSGTAGLSTGTAWTNTSDARIKKDVATITGATDKLKRLRPVSYKYTDQYLSVHSEIDGSKTYHSFIADEYATVFPDAVSMQGDLIKVTPEVKAVVAQDAVLYVEEDEIPDGKSVGDVRIPAVEAVEAAEEVRETLLTDLKQYTPHDLQMFLTAAVQELDARIAALEAA